MIDLKQVKTLLKVAGITKLKLTFDGDSQVVIVEYVFRGAPGYTKHIAWEEIKESLEIGIADIPVPGNEKPGSEVAHRAASIPPA